jgi:hypothetical protein
MPRLLQTAATLVVACSIALQVPLSGLVLAGHSGFDPFAIICTSDSAGDHNGPLQQHRNDCNTCPVACGGGSPVMPSGPKLSLVLFAGRVQPSALWIEPLPMPARHQPQASRAPPIHC